MVAQVVGCGVAKQGVACNCCWVDSEEEEEEDSAMSAAASAKQRLELRRAKMGAGGCGGGGRCSPGTVAFHSPHSLEALPTPVTLLLVGAGFPWFGGRLPHIVQCCICAQSCLM